MAFRSIGLAWGAAAFLAGGFPGAGQSPPSVPVLRPAGGGDPLEGTAALGMEGDISVELVEGVHRFLDAAIARSPQRRAELWRAPEDPERLVADMRRRLGGLLGTPDMPADDPRFEFHGTGTEGPLLATGAGFRVYTVRWPAFRNVTGTGLLLIPDGKTKADVVAIPDADLTPEQLAGVSPIEDHPGPYAARLASSGCRVLVPLLISRDDRQHRMAMREYLNRPAYELGRHIIGYEVQKVLAGFDCLRKSREDGPRPCGVIGWGEGALLSLHCAALRGDIAAACVSGHFGPREETWREPSYRNLFGLLESFGDAELAALIAPRPLIIEAAPGPEITVAPAEFNEAGRPAGKGYPMGKPGRLTTPSSEQVDSETRRAATLAAALEAKSSVDLIEAETAGSKPALDAFLAALGVPATTTNPGGSPVRTSRNPPDPEVRMEQQAGEIMAHHEAILAGCAGTRDAFMKDLRLDTPADFERTVETYRNHFRHRVIGHFDQPLAAPNARSRKFQEGVGVTSYEIVLDVFPDVIAYGILTVPDGIGPGEKRPVVVCQHGLEGRPQHVIGEEKFSAYKAFATRLAQRGFVTFAPQNLYLGNDRFRLLQFKANSIGKTLFSVMVPQHEQIVRWLGSLPFVDADRIGFYGLSYGGKSAMRIPPLVPGYALSICSADFNEWVWKNCSTISRYSYTDKREYEIFEWNLGRTFNYAEMAALIAPRPFMVERGHHDGVAPDEMVAHEYAKVRRLYGRLGIGERTEIEWFPGPHTINGVGTFAFLHRWLDWPAPGE